MLWLLFTFTFIIFLNPCDSNVFCFVFLSCWNIVLLIFLLSFNFLCTFTLFAFINFCLIKFNLFVLIESFILFWTLFMFYCLLLSLLLALLWCSLVLLFYLLNWNPNSFSDLLLSFVLFLLVLFALSSLTLCCLCLSLLLSDFGVFVGCVVGCCALVSWLFYWKKKLYSLWLLIIVSMSSNVFSSSDYESDVFPLLNSSSNESSSLLDSSDISLLKLFLIFWFNGGNCAVDVMFGVVLVFICCRKLSTLFWFVFFVGYGSIVIDDTDDDGVSNIVFGCGRLLGKVSTILFHDDCSFLSLLGCCCGFGSFLALSFGSLSSSRRSLLSFG